jgi:hypothetical protein
LQLAGAEKTANKEIAMGEAAGSASADSLTPEPHSTLRKVEAKVNYLAEMTEMPVFYSENVSRNNLRLQPETVAIYDARPLQDQLSFDREGLALVQHLSAVKDFWDQDQIENIYRAEIEKLVFELTGAARVLVTPRAVPRYAERAGEAPRTLINSRPARFVHSDYSAKSATEFAMHRWGEQPPELLERRYAAYNLWRAISPPPQDVPLAVCDARTVAFTDHVTAEAVIDAPNAPEMRFESTLIRFNPAHRWYYFPDMHADELLVFKAFDSDPDQPYLVPHSAFDDPNCPVGVPPRASIEIRAFAFFDE